VHLAANPNLRGARIARTGRRGPIDLARAYCEMGLIADAVSEALLAALGRRRRGRSSTR
jgi:hypothetical protein